MIRAKTSIVWKSGYRLGRDSRLRNPERPGFGGPPIYGIPYPGSYLTDEDGVVIEVPLAPVDVPALEMHTGHGQREGNDDAQPHMRRLMLRKRRQSPLGFLRFLWVSLRLEIEARKRGTRR